MLLLPATHAEAFGRLDDITSSAHMDFILQRFRHVMPCLWLA